jgi:hypothetical protein
MFGSRFWPELKFKKTKTELTAHKSTIMKKLSIEKMQTIVGGNVSRAEYCATLGMIICNNPVTDAMANAWNDNCGAYGYSLPCTTVS